MVYIYGICTWHIYMYVCMYIYMGWYVRPSEQRSKGRWSSFLGALLENFRQVSIQDACFLNVSRLDGGPKAIPIAVHTNLGHSLAVGLCSIGQSLQIVDFRTFPLYMFAMYSIYSYASTPWNSQNLRAPRWWDPHSHKLPRSFHQCTFHRDFASQELCSTSRCAAGAVGCSLGPAQVVPRWCFAGPQPYYLGGHTLHTILVYLCIGLYLSIYQSINPSIYQSIYLSYPIYQSYPSYLYNFLSYLISIYSNQI